MNAQTMRNERGGWTRCRDDGRRAAILAILLVLTPAARSEPKKSSAAPDLLFHVKRIHTATGAPLDDACVLVRGGRIAAVGPKLEAPPGAKIVELRDAVITPGLIDACCVMDFEIPEVSLRSGVYANSQSLWGQIVHEGEDARAAADPEAEHACSPACSGPQTADAAGELFASGPSAWQTWAEHSSEVVPQTRVIDSVNLLSTDFKRLLREGVTTVYVSPDSASVIGARGAVVKTGGPISGRVVRDADAVKASLGRDPIRRGRGNSLPPYYGPTQSVFTRRPTTRMGVDFVFRKAFYDAARDAEGLPLHGADQPPADALPILRAVRAGEIPLRIQARRQHDIYSALRLAKEFGLRFTLEEATEAYLCIDALREAQLPVIYGPIYDEPAGFRAFSGEANEARLATPRLLREAGLRFALTAQEMRDEEGLARQGMYAVRCGLSADEALRAITAVPAELMKLDGLGTLAPGAVADLVVWSGEPFDATSRPLIVVIDGRIVLEN